MTVNVNFKNVISEQMQNMQPNGSILIADNDMVLYENCFGYADIAKQIPISFNTQFLVGSVTKQFTAVAILKALLDKNLAEGTNDINDLQRNIQTDLNTPIHHYLSEKHDIWSGSMPLWANAVTVHQLLVHSSGITNYTSLPDFENMKFHKVSDLVAFFKSHDLDFPPGTKFSYSNSGYFLLGIIIQQISNQNLDVYMLENFFKPLDMHSSFLPMSDTADNLIKSDSRFANLARGYQFGIATPNASLEEVKKYVSMEVPGAAGSLISSALDLLKWNKGLYSGKIIPDFLLKLMLKPYMLTEQATDHYGYGIEIMKSDALGEYYTHRGGIPGYHSILTYIPLLQISIVVLENIVANQENLKPEIEKIKAELSSSLSENEIIQQVEKMLESKYPSIIENKNRYLLGSLYETVIKCLNTNTI